MTRTELKQMYPLVWQVFFSDLAPPAPPTTAPKPKRNDYETWQEWVAELKKWNENGGE